MKKTPGMIAGCEESLLPFQMEGQHYLIIRDRHWSFFSFALQHVTDPEEQTAKKSNFKLHFAAKIILILKWFGCICFSQLILDIDSVTVKQKEIF